MLLFYLFSIKKTIGFVDLFFAVIDHTAYTHRKKRQYIVYYVQYIAVLFDIGMPRCYFCLRPSLGVI